MAKQHSYKECDQWIKEVSSKAVKQAIMNGDKAFKRFLKVYLSFQDIKARCEVLLSEKQQNRLDSRKT